MRKFYLIVMCVLLLFPIVPSTSLDTVAAETSNTIIYQPEIFNNQFDIEPTIPGWSVVTTNEISEVHISSKQSFDGNNSLYFNNASDDEQLQVTSDLIPIEAENNYTAQAQVFVIHQTHSIGYEVHYYDANKNKISTPTFVNHPKGSLALNDWNLIETPFETPKDASFVQLRFNSGKIALTEAYFDDIHIKNEQDEDVSNILNPQFEEPIPVPGWELVTTNDISYIELNNEYQTSGKYSLHFSNGSDNEQLQVKSEKIAVTSGEEYKATASIFVTEQTHSIGYEVHFFDDNDNKVGTPVFINHAKGSLAENDWDMLETPFIVPENASFVELRFNSGKIAKTNAYIDDVFIKHIEEEENQEPGDTDPEVPINEYAKDVINGSFEEDVIDGIIPGWQSEFTGPGITVSDRVARTGDYSLHLHDEDDQKSVSVISDKISVEANEAYLLTVHAYVIAQTHNIVSEIRFFDENGKKVGEKRELNGNLPKEQWIDLKLFAEAPANAEAAQITLYSGGISLTEVYFDDIMLDLVAEDLPLEREYSPAENLGDMVHVQLGQAGVIQENSLGENEVYYHSNGLPGTFSVLNAETGELKFQEVIPNTEALWAMTVGPDKNVYFAGTADGMLYRYNPVKQAIEKLGKNPSDNWVWDLEVSEDGVIYGTTYPNASLFSYDITTDTFRDFGSLSTEQYARGLTIDGDYIYVGIGTVRHFLKVNRHTGETEEIHLEGYTGETGTIEKAYVVNGKLFISVSTINMIVVDLDTMDIVDRFQYSNKISPVDPNNSSVFYYKFEDKLYTYNTDTLSSTVIDDIPLLPDTVRVKDMQWITLNSGELVLAMITQYGEFMYYHPDTNTLNFTLLDIADSAVAIQSLETGPDGNLYMGGYQRGMSVYNPYNDEIETNISSFAQPEGIGFLNGIAYFGTYVDAIMYRYDHKQPVDLNSNPQFAYDIEDQQDRPFAITSGENKLFVGTIPDYGVLGGALAIYDAETDTWMQERNIVENQSIIGLTYHNGKLYGGTSVWGGLGIDPVADEAKIFVWDVATGKKIDEFTPDIPGIDQTPKMIGDLSIGPDGNLWGIVDGTIFALDIETMDVVKSKMIRPSLYNSSKWFPYRLAWAPDGMLYTTLSRQLMAIDPETLQYKVLDDQFMNSMTVGIDGSIFYAIGTELRKISVPETDATLQSIHLNGESMDDFTPGQLKYTLYGDESLFNKIEVVTTQDGASAVIDILDDKATITVTGIDGISTLVYGITLTNEKPDDGDGSDEDENESDDDKDSDEDENESDDDKDSDEDENGSDDNNDSDDDENESDDDKDSDDGENESDDNKDSNDMKDESDDNKDSNDMKDESDDGNDADDERSNSLPKTGTSVPVYLVIGLFLFVCGNLLFFLRRKNRA